MAISIKLSLNLAHLRCKLFLRMDLKPTSPFDPLLTEIPSLRLTQVPDLNEQESYFFSYIFSNSATYHLS